MICVIILITLILTCLVDLLGELSESGFQDFGVVNNQKNHGSDKHPV